MGEKCDSHDPCFNRLYGKIEGVDSNVDKVNDKLDRLVQEIRDRLHEGDVRFTQIEMRLAHVEKTLATSSSGRIDFKQRAINFGFNLLQLAIIAILTAAIWAVKNGYGK